MKFQKFIKSEPWLLIRLHRSDDSVDTHACRVLQENANLLRSFESLQSWGMVTHAYGSRRQEDYC